MTQPPAANPPSGAGAPTTTAGLGVRFGARFLDALIIGLPVGIVLGVMGLADGLFVSTLLSIAYFGYYVYFEANQGATLGKKILNLKVVAADGSPPTMEAAAKRNAWMLIGLIPVLGGILGFIAVIVIAVTISSNAHNRGKHDEFADTAVMR